MSNLTGDSAAASCPSTNVWGLLVEHATGRIVHAGPFELIDDGPRTIIVAPLGTDVVVYDGTPKLRVWPLPRPSIN